MLASVVGAIYRDTLELEVQVWLASSEFASGQLARGVPEAFVVTADKVAGLAAAYDRGNDNIPAWRAEITALRAQGLEPVPDERFITQIFAIVGYFCGQIVTEKDPAYEECRQPKLMQGLPVATGLGRRLSGFGTGTSTTTTVVRTVQSGPRTRHSSTGTGARTARTSTSTSEVDSLTTPTVRDARCVPPSDDACLTLVRYLFGSDNKVRNDRLPVLERLLTNVAPKLSGRVLVVITKKQFADTRKNLVQAAKTEGVALTPGN